MIVRRSSQSQRSLVLVQTRASMSNLNQAIDAGSSHDEHILVPEEALRSNAVLWPRRSSSSRKPRPFGLGGQQNLNSIQGQGSQQEYL